MSTLNEEIARLTGKLVFNVDSAGFRRFDSMMKSASNRLNQLSQQYSKLAQDMGKGLKLKIDDSALNKARAKLDRTLKRQSRAESALTNQRRTTFQTELSQQKLKYANTRAQVFAESQSLKAQKEAALVAAKAAATQAKATGVSKQQLATQDALTRSLIRQARLEQITTRTREASRKAQDAHLASMTKLQRAQHQINEGARRAQASAQLHARRMAAADQQQANRTQASDQSARRFQMSQERHTAWQAKQAQIAARPQNDIRAGMGMGMGLGPMLALGGIGAAIAGLTAVVGSLGQRVEQRQQNVMGAEQFNAQFMAISPDKGLQDFWREAYLQSQVKNGGSVDVDSAQSYRNFVMSQNAFGKSAQDTIKAWDQRQAAFTIGGATQADAKELNRQLAQMAADGVGDRQDYNIITDRLPSMVPYLARAFGEVKGIDDSQKAMTALTRYTKDGKGVEYAWFERAMQMMVSENQHVLEQRRGTVGFARQQAENQAFLNDNQINTNEQLTSVIKENVQAHRELNEALQPLARTLRTFDENLTRLQTGIIQRFLGKNFDGSAKTPEQNARDVGSIGTVGDAAIDFSALTGAEVSDKPIDPNRDPINRFWNWAMGKSTALRPESELLGQIPRMDRLAEGMLQPEYGRELSEPMPYFNFDMATLGDTFQRMQDSMGVYAQGAIPAATTVNAPVNVTVEGAHIEVTMNGSASESDRQELVQMISNSQRDIERSMRTTSEDAIREMLGYARANQAERE